MSWETVNLYNKHHARNFEYTMDTRTNELYSYESEEVIRTKSAAIIIGLPIYTALFSAYNLLKIPVDVVMRRSVKEISMDVWNAVKSPFFAIAVFFAALITLISPFEGRRIEAKIEREWQNGVDFFKDVKAKDIPSCYGFHKDAESPGAFYLAWCFQSRGLATDQTLFESPHSPETPKQDSSAPSSPQDTE